MKGSFKYGDFHFAEGKTYSDVDVIYSHNEQVRHDLAQRIARDLKSCGHNIRVSVLAKDYTRSISLTESRMLRVLEYLRFARRCEDDPSFASYLLAKTSLGLISNKPSDRLADSCFSSDALIEKAVESRLGIRCDFSLVDAKLLMEAQDCESASVFVSVLLGDRDWAYMWCLEKLSTSSLDDWLKRRLHAHLIGA
ncbi:hypothetical protein LG324_09515 [Phycicoccus jejuensis]|uniref:hypothetical protein n=1 Tax=Phycicoccus jejuensis TaxID=367299 RepID=UPI00384CC14C